MLRGEGAPRVLLVLAITLTATWIVFSSFRPSGTVDLWWTLRVGDHIRSHGEVPRTTLWTMEAVRELPYLAHGWMATVVFSAVAQHFGLDMVPVVPCLLGLGVLAAILWVGRLSGVSASLSVGLAVTVLYPLLPRLMNRAESFGYLCFALALCVLADFGRRRQLTSLLWLIPLGVVWVNLHGSFLILLGIAPLLAAGLFFDAWRAAGWRPASIWACIRDVPLAFLSLLWLACFAVTLLNPYGSGLLGSVLEQSSSPLWEQLIQEWSPLYQREQVPLRFWLSLAAALAALVAARRRFSGFSLLLALVCFGLAVSSYRHVSLVGLGSVLLLADFAKGVELDRRGRLAVGATLSAALLLASASAAARRDWPSRSLERHPSPYATPEGVDYIRRHLRGNVLNDWNLGGLLIYFAHPQVRVAIDSRADPYPPPYVRAWWGAISGSASDTLRFVDRYQIDHIILTRSLYSLWMEPKLDQLEGFQKVYTDGRLVVLSRPPVGRSR